MYVRMYLALFRVPNRVWHIPKQPGVTHRNTAGGPFLTGVTQRNIA